MPMQRFTINDVRELHRTLHAMIESTTQEVAPTVISTPSGVVLNQEKVFLLEGPKSTQRRRSLRAEAKRASLLNRPTSICSSDDDDVSYKMVSRPSGTLLNQPDVQLLMASPTSVSSFLERSSEPSILVL